MLSFYQGTRFMYLKITDKSHPLCVAFLLLIMSTVYGSTNTGYCGGCHPFIKRLKNF